MTWKWHLDLSASSDKCGITFRRVTEESDEMLPPLHPSMLSERLRSFNPPPIIPKPQPLKRKREVDDVDEIRRFRRVRLLDSANRCKLYSLGGDDWHDHGTGFGRSHLVEVSS